MLGMRSSGVVFHFMALCALLQIRSLFVLHYQLVILYDIMATIIILAGQHYTTKGLFLYNVRL